MTVARWDARDTVSQRVPEPTSGLGPDIDRETPNSCLRSRLSHMSQHKLCPQAKIGSRAEKQRGHTAEHMTQHTGKHTEKHTENSGTGGQNA